jgi:hypothetical protein
MGRARTLVTFTVVVVGGTAVPSRAHGTDPDLHGVTCARNGPITITPGLTTSPRDVSYTERAVLDPCVTAGGTPIFGLTGVIAVNGTAHGSCALITDPRPTATVTWSDGTASELRGIDGIGVPPVATADDTVVSGRGAGSAVHTSALVTSPMDPLSACFTEDGLRHANLVGYIGFD